MQDLNPIAAFIAVVQNGSFGSAARQLRVEKSTLSRRVAALEESLGLPLLRRTTRKMVLTPEGLDYFNAIRPALDTIASATKKLQTNPQDSISGTVRITAPVILGQTSLIKPLAELSRAHPRIRVELLVDDKVLDVTQERIDIAIRGGSVDLKGAKARRLGFTTFKLYASPAYLESQPKIFAPLDLKQHRCILYVPDSEPYPWHLVHERDSRERCRIKLRDPLRANQLVAIRELCKADAGIALLPTVLVEDALISGELLPVLKDWGAERSAYYLVIPHSHVQSEAVRVAAQFLGERMK